MRVLPITAIVAAVSTIAPTQIASAADQGPPAHKAPVYKAPPPPPAPVYNWTGVYVGGNVGGSWGNARTDIAGSATTVSTIGPFAITNPPATFADSQTQRLSGFIGGGQIGYNYQFSPRWVLGFEADIQGSGERASNAFADPFSSAQCTSAITSSCNDNGFVPINGTAVTAYDAKIGWFGTARGRLGALIGDQVLLYGTGGLAYGHVELSGITRVNGSANPPFGTVPFLKPGATAFSESGTKVRYAVGGGMEGKWSYWLPTGWTWKVEYLYVDLGSLDTVSPFPGATPYPLVPTSPFTGVITTHTRFTDNIVRVGLNYKFGYAIAPAIYK